MSIHSITVSIHYCIFITLNWIFFENKYLVCSTIKLNWKCNQKNHWLYDGEMLLMTFAKLLSPHNKHNGIAKHRGWYYLCLTSFEQFHVRVCACMCVCVREPVCVTCLKAIWNHSTIYFRFFNSFGNSLLEMHWLRFFSFPFKPKFNSYLWRWHVTTMFTFGSTNSLRFQANREKSHMLSAK